MEGILKKGALGERDWYHLESKIRSHIHDLMQPYILKAEQSRDAVRDMREIVNSLRATIEDLSMG